LSAGPHRPDTLADHAKPALGCEAFGLASSARHVSARAQRELPAGSRDLPRRRCCACTSGEVLLGLLRTERSEIGIHAPEELRVTEHRRSARRRAASEPSARIGEG
jgi:hypothetical protein